MDKTNCPSLESAFYKGKSTQQIFGSNRLSIILLVLFFASCGRVTPDKGVSIELAQERKLQLSDIHYSLHFNIPVNISDSITGKSTITFTLKKRNPIVLDFRGTPEMVHSVKVGSKNINYRFVNGHIIIPRKHTRVGENSIVVEFASADGSLNRSNDFLYTLLVPDRASTVFPCFDQPDLKARFELSLNIPSKWTALSNGKTDSITYISNEMKRMVFKQTKPISTYLFAFAVGNFKVETRAEQGHVFSLYHRETDSQKLEINLSEIFKLHAESLNWLEEYTGIPYPFEKLDFILIPGFQYSGMEHPGAIYYRDSRLLLESDPSITQQLSRANLIAHEVAHQWFGNLVTMRWFNDVWLKEVFAGFMADLMVNPQFPDINHQLRFVLSHHPRAYSVDRTQGANPIVQPLDNMLNAGTLYGEIIYHKSPIMMQQLEMVMGSQPFRDGVNEYLRKYSMDNADWDELVDILDKHSDENLKNWAEIWTQETGRATIGCNFDSANNLLHVKPLDSTKMPPMWIDISTPQRSSKLQRFWLDTLPVTISLDAKVGTHDFPILNSSGIGYGCFVPEKETLNNILKSPEAMKDDMARASTHISLFEMFLEGLIDCDRYMEMLLVSLDNESDPQIRSYLLGSLEVVFWKFVSVNKRDIVGESVEETLWKLLRGNLPIDQRRTVLKTLVKVFTSNETFSELYTAWSSNKVLDIELNEEERTSLAYELMIRKPNLFHAIAFGEVERISNPDRIAKFDFMLGALSPTPSQRLEFFEKLKSPNNRKPEPWVIEALQLLHHPLRSDFSIRFIEPSLDMLPEIQQTGDIFFPTRWLNATLDGHSSPEAIEIVEDWLKANPELSPNLRMKLLQSADMLFRTKQNAVEIHTNTFEQIM